MDLKNCPQCGRLFAKDGHKLCPVCREKEEDKFQIVKDYLWENPKSSIDQVHEETGVEKELIIKFVKEDRLLMEGIDLNFELECERCGKPISHGRFCADCQKELTEGFSPKKKKSRKKKKKSSQKMYTKDWHSRKQDKNN